MDQLDPFVENYWRRTQTEIVSLAGVINDFFKQMKFSKDKSLLLTTQWEETKKGIVKKYLEQERLYLENTESGKYDRIQGCDPYFYLVWHNIYIKV